MAETVKKRSKRGRNATMWAGNGGQLGGMEKGLRLILRQRAYAGVFRGVTEGGGNMSRLEEQLAVESGVLTRALRMFREVTRG